MILGEGLFQADGHPGNILVQKGGGIALLDYGQSKQLPYEERVAFAKLVVALDGGRTKDIDEALTELGVRTSKPDTALRREMAYGMFDTFGTVRRECGWVLDGVWNVDTFGTVRRTGGWDV